MTTCLRVAAIGVAEVAAGDDRHAERREESGRDRAEARARILFAVRLGVALGRELEARDRTCRRRATARSCRRRRARRRAAPRCAASRPCRSRASCSGPRSYDMIGTFSASTLRVLKPGLRPLQREQRRQQHAGAGQQHERRGDLRHREQRAAGGSCREVMRTLPLDRLKPLDASDDGSRGTNARRIAAATRQADADPQQARVDRQVERADREARRVARQDGHHRPRDQHAEDRAGAAEQQALGQQRPPQRPLARAERRADRQLPFAPHRARQDQVGDVRAGDDEHQRRRRQQHQQHGPRRRGDLIAQAHRVDPEVCRPSDTPRDAP